MHVFIFTYIVFCQALDGFFLAIMTDGNIIYASESVTSLLEHLPVSITPPLKLSINQQTVTEAQFPSTLGLCVDNIGVSVLQYSQSSDQWSPSLCCWGILTYVVYFSLTLLIRTCWTSCLLVNIQKCIRLCPLMSWKERHWHPNI